MCPSGPRYCAAGRTSRMMTWLLSSNISLATVGAISAYPPTTFEMPTVLQARHASSANGISLRMSILSNKLQIEFGAYFADQGSGHVPERPVAVPMQLRTGSNVDAEELQGPQDH